MAAAGIIDHIEHLLLAIIVFGEAFAPLLSEITGLRRPFDLFRYFLMLGDRVFELLFQPTRRCFRSEPSRSCRCCTMIGRGPVLQ